MAMEWELQRSPGGAAEEGLRSAHASLPLSPSKMMTDQVEAIYDTSFYMIRGGGFPKLLMSGSILE